MTGLHPPLVLGHAGGLDEFLLILALVGIPLVVLGFFARRVRHEADDEDDADDADDEGHHPSVG